MDSNSQRIGFCCPFCAYSGIHIRQGMMYKDNPYICYKCRKEFSKPSERILRGSFGPPKRKPTDMTLFSRKRLLFKLEGMAKRDKALISILYLTGARVSEVVGKNGLKLKNFESFNEPVRKMVNGKTYHFVYVQNINTLKKRKQGPTNYRDIPLCLERDRDFLEIFDVYLDKIIEIHGWNPEQPLFNISRQRAHKLIKKIGIYPHFLRTLRSTHLVQGGMDAYELKRWHNWSDLKPSEFYVMKNMADLERKVV